LKDHTDNQHLAQRQFSEPDALSHRKGMLQWPRHQHLAGDFRHHKNIDDGCLEQRFRLRRTLGFRC
jgi:hypothetical protein